MDADLEDILNRHRQTHAVVWDFDGVLSETEALHQESYTRVLAAHGMRTEGDWYTPLIGNTAQQNWRSLIAGGLDATVDDIGRLESQREAVFQSLAASGLTLSRIGASLIPAFAQGGARQDVVSNGDLNLIRHAVQQWGVGGMVNVVSRAPGTDKLALLEERAAPGVVTFDDTDRYVLAAARKGAYTVGVRHRHNAHASLPADVVLHIASAASVAVDDAACAYG
ncbi:hypothetical protein [Streptomyces sp. P9-A2]|uniref:hypothetical protein n=1 Tax=Streptomyces sp. P9-A2 TaxID=3072284 RepID=UPI002FC60B6A